MENHDKLTLTTIIKNSVHLYGNTPALSFVNEDPLTFKDAGDSANKVAAFLSSRNMNPGDKVAILSENMPNWGVTYFGISLAGGIIVPILPDFHPNEIKNIIDHSSAKIIFVSKKIYEKIQDLNIDNEREFILLDDFSLIQAGRSVSDIKAESGEYFFKSTMEIPNINPEEEDLAVIIYTAGTTGSSKGVMLSHKNICSNAIASNKIADMKPGHTLVSILPLSHSYECTLGFIIPFSSGSCVYYLRKPPSATVLLPALKTVKPHLMLSVPLLIEKIVRQSVLPNIEKKAVLRTLFHFPLTHKLIARLAGKKLLKTFGNRLFFFGIGGAGLASDVENFLKDAKFPYAIGYGLTETAPLIAGANATTSRFTATGKVIDGGEVKIVNPHKDTGEGEIIYKGPNVMMGYYKDSEKTSEVISNEGWFRTGDLGIFDKDNYLYIKGRVKTIMLGASGENIYPEAIESVINEFDFIEESVVFQDEGKIFALVHIDKEALTESVKHLKEGAIQASENAAEYTKELLKKVNKQLNSFSKIANLRHEEEPFEKTPKNTIKRYLYTKFKKQNKD
ncbi:MAG: AMP-binding protein [Spirochaetia bacterium]|jgi:long-chain acyl-CoA synthetase|nr:AMP-binding protein [Spirochaetia bacterium]